MINRLQILDGLWKLATDPDNKGREERWYECGPTGESLEAPVPGIIQQVYPDYHGVVWYWHRFRTTLVRETGERLFIKFGAADYLAQVWLNGHYAGEHEGGETPFMLDVTGIIHEDGDNLLAVRLLNPTYEPIDGITLKQTPHRHKFNDLLPGLCLNYGGIYYPVELIKTSGVWISDVFAAPNVSTGQINITVTVKNHYESDITGQLTVNVWTADNGIILTSREMAISINPQESIHKQTISISQPRLWSLGDPYLYRIEVELEASVRTKVELSKTFVRCGFRDFRVEKGYFRLNGKRIFIRATHTGNHYPISWVVPQDPDLLRKDLVFAKACGFNMVRFIAGVAHPVQLDFCDEIGLLVYEETNAGWHFADSYKGNVSEHLADSPELHRRYRTSYTEMILRDRNHPSIVVWGLLNETYDGPVFYYAKDYLQELRTLDDTRLVLLNSGRFDGQLSIGSVSNPGSKEWEHMWGNEAPGKPRASKDKDHGVPAYIENAGDIHVYPVQPQSKMIDHFIRTVGHDTKPVFLSEYGAASQADVIGAVRMYEQLKVRADLAEVVLYRSIAESYLADMKKYKMNDVYAFPEDMFVDSQRLHARLRLKGLDLIRSNPKICGYNLTGMLDHAISGEGIWDFWRVWKPESLDAVSSGFAPLRWCLFIGQMHCYAGRKVRFEAVLANEDVLKPGHYPAQFKIRGPQGTLWETTMDVSIPEPGFGEDGPLAVPVFSEEVLLEGCTGIYEFSADTTNWKELLSRIARGGTAVFLAPAAFQRGEDAVGWLPLEKKGRCNCFYDSVYHKDCVAKKHAIFEGLQEQGVMDCDYYGEIIPHNMFEGQDAPVDTAAAAFAVGYLCTGGYASGLLFGGYTLGEGRFFLNTLHIMENIDSHPAADRLLLNIIRYAGTNKEKPLAAEPENMEELIRGVFQGSGEKLEEYGVTDDDMLLQTFTGKKNNQYSTALNE